MDFYNGLSDFKPGDTVNVIAPANYDTTEYGFGIEEHEWKAMMDTSPHTIVAELSGHWRGYELSNCKAIAGRNLIWPYWGLELADKAPVTVFVDDLI